MTTSDALWEVFKATGHIGAYLLYKDYFYQENFGELKEETFRLIDSMNAE